MFLSRVIRPCVGVSRHVSLRRNVSILSTDKLEATVDDKTGVCSVVMNNAPVNVLERTMLAGIRDLAVEADKSPNITGFVLKSALPNVFCAGLDIQELLTVEKDEKRFRDYWTSLHETVLAVFDMEGVSVAAFNGTCVAGGLVISLAFDCRIMEEGKHKIGFSETRLGVDCPYFASELFKDLCGMRESMAALPYGQFYDVKSAHRIGLIDEICPAGQMDNTVDSFINKALAIPAEARNTTKRNLRHQTLAFLRAMQPVDLDHKAELFKRPEIKKQFMDYLLSMNKGKS